MEKFTFDSAVRGYHVYKDVWKPAIGEKLHAEQEPDNAVDRFAMNIDAMVFGLYGVRNVIAPKGQ